MTLVGKLLMNFLKIGTLDIFNLSTIYTVKIRKGRPEKDQPKPRWDCTSSGSILLLLCPKAVMGGLHISEGHSHKLPP